MNIVFAATALAVTLAAAPAMSAVVLDQDNLMTVTNGGYSNLIGGPQEARQAQFVTSHRTGKLTRIDLQLRDANRFTGSIAVELVSVGTAAALPTTFGTPVATISSSVLSLGVAGAVTSVDVSAANFMVSPGVKFAILLRSLTPGTNARFGWLYGDVDPGTGLVISTRDYTRGLNNFYNVYLDGAGATYWGRSGLDRGFATYVDVTGTGVPEPASWALLIAGFGLSGAAMRRRRVVAA